ncbi:MAG: glycoside hydrolase family 3 C-terminal domain-containing protein [Prolixibacteraceae bacterium]|jgi:beta-glucosidase|nr:glycoside hydrolase family 3 C-terminal domain-containing protein [Prolixibacteraceae bacterium]
MKKLTILFITFLFAGFANSQQPSGFKFLNPDLPVEERVGDLISQMTLDEKIGQLVHTAPAIPRLQVPEYNWWNECLHGLARTGYATVFPQSLTIASSFNTDLIFDVATIISDEARAKHHEYLRQGQRGIYQGLTFWSPNINILRDPRWGRGHETYGEDPYLMGEMGSQFIRGLQGDDPKYLKLVATSKHFAVHSGPEALRHSFDTDVSDRDLYETYLPAFYKTVTGAKVYSIMSAYNRFRGESTTAHPFLLQQLLRDQWGFEGYVVSDCGAVADIYKGHRIMKTAEEAAALSIKSGCDINCGNTFSHLGEAVKKGYASEADIDLALKRIFTARFKLGMFDPVEIVPYAQIPYAALCSDYHHEMARKAAQESIVLLKNKENILPFSGEKIKKLAVIGPNADNWEALIGNYNGMPKNPVTVLKGLQNKLSPETEIAYSLGTDLAEGIHNLQVIPSCYWQTEDGRQGLTGEYFANKNFEGQALFTKTEDKIDFYWEQGTPDPRMKDDDYSVRWTGYLVPPVSGTYQLGSWIMSGGRVFLDGEQLFKVRAEHHAMYQEKTVDLQAGKKYKVVFEYYNFIGDGDAELLWAMPRRNLLPEAVETARSADAVVLVLGLSQRIEGEEMPVKLKGFERGDRTLLDLPDNQQELLEAVAATGKPVILVIMAGSAISVNWAQEHVDAILYAGYPGEEGGNAIADVLLGDYNPAGRLPVTYYKSVDQLPPFEDYNMAGRTYRYFNDEPLYPFGYGLSYTTFSYSGLKLPETVKAGETVPVSVIVTNSGKKDGDEVVQLYLTDEKASTPRPIRQLEGFKRIRLKAGESRTVEFLLNARQLSIIDKKGNRSIEPGWFGISVGGEQPGFSGYLNASTTETVSGRFKVLGTTHFEIK